MHPDTRERLGFLISWYHKMRCSTLLLLDSHSPEDLTWQLNSHLPTAQWIFAHLAAMEDWRIHRRQRGKAMLDDLFLKAYRPETGWEAARDYPLAGDELHAMLCAMKRSTDRFLRRVLNGEQTALHGDLLEQLEELIFREFEHMGQIQYLGLLRDGAASRKQSIRPGRAGLPVWQGTAKPAAKRSRP